MSEWLARRRSGITGTDMAAILGVHPFKSALEVWGVKTGRLDEKDLGHREEVYWGNVLEPVVLGEYHRRTGRVPLMRQRWAMEGRTLLQLQHDDGPKVMLTLTDQPHLLMTPDDMDEAWTPVSWLEEQVAHDGPGVVEAKTTNYFGLKEWQDQAPLYHQVQGAYNAAVAGVEWFAVTGLIGGQRQLTYDYGLEADKANWLLDRASRFWRDNVVGGKEPEIQRPWELDIWTKLHPNDNGECLTLSTDEDDELTSRMLRTDADLVAAKSLLKETEARVAVLQLGIKKTIRDSTFLEMPGHFRYSFKTQEGPHGPFRMLRRKGLEK